MTNGIYLNGEPLDLSEVTDVRIMDDAFEFHYIYRPAMPRNYHRRALRRSPVRHLSALEVAQIQEIKRANAHFTAQAKRKGGDQSG
jgi:hypothetical protein